MISPPRFEAKYRLDACKYRQVRNGLTPYFGLDRVSRSAGGRYLVSSLYYDTSELIAYSEKCWVEAHTHETASAHLLVRCLQCGLCEGRAEAAFRPAHPKNGGASVSRRVSAFRLASALA